MSLREGLLNASTHLVFSSEPLQETADESDDGAALILREDQKRVIEARFARHQAAALPHRPARQRSSGASPAMPARRNTAFGIVTCPFLPSLTRSMVTTLDDSPGDYTRRHTFRDPEFRHHDIPLQKNARVARDRGFGVPHRLAIALLLFVPALPAALAQIPDAPNCSVDQPPSDSGAFGTPGGFLLVYPRNAGLSDRYTGCKTLWVVDAPGHETLMAIIRNIKV